MRVLIGLFLTILLVSGGLNARADTAIIVKGGTVDLTHQRQSLDNAERTFGDSSNAAFAAAWEMRKRDGIGFGMEYLRYRHSYSPPATGEAKAQALLFNVKEYFGRHLVHPFAGVGIGLGHTSVTGGADVNPELQLALQAAGGVELRVRHLGLYVEVKGVYFDVDRSDHYDPSGTGVFAGVSFVF